MPKSTPQACHRDTNMIKPLTFQSKISCSKAAAAAYQKRQHATLPLLPIPSEANQGTTERDRNRWFKCAGQDLPRPLQQSKVHHGFAKSIPACSNPCNLAARHPIWRKCGTVSTQGYLCIPPAKPVAGVPPKDSNRHKRLFSKITTLAGKSDRVPVLSVSRGPYRMQSGILVVANSRSNNSMLKCFRF